MDILKGKRGGSKYDSKDPLPFYSRRPSGWATIVCLSLFLACLLLGSVSVGTKNTQSAMQQPLLWRLMGQKQGTVASANLQVLSGLNRQLLSQKLDTHNCEPTDFGSGWVKHTLCGKQAPTKPCYFYSFGISVDYSFDVDLANRWGCTGVAADPTIVHNSTLHPGVTFHNIAANSPWLAAQKNSKWLKTSVPGLRKWLKHDRLAVLKMDCEGCEYSIAADVLAEDPMFFSKVDQLAIEVHWSKVWLKSKTELHAIARLLELLEEAGLKLMHADLTACAPADVATGLLPELQEYMGVLFAPKPDLHCHNYLFARI